MSFIQNILARHPALPPNADPAAMARLLSFEPRPSGDLGVFSAIITDLNRVGADTAIIGDVVLAWSAVHNSIQTEPLSKLHRWQLTVE
jgi:hypothetical protein